MRQRIAKKMAAQISASALSLTFALSHARPSFWQLRDVGQQRKYLRTTLTTPFGPHGLGVHPNHARHATRRWTPADWPVEWRTYPSSSPSATNG